MKDGEEKTSAPQASVRDVFSFAKTRRIRLCIAGSFTAACVSGACLPAIAFYFAKAFMDLARSTSSDVFLSSVRSIAFVFMSLGVILMTSMTIQATLQETAAAEMTKAFKKSWFRALLRQDMAYYDIEDVAGQATTISSNGNKFKKGVGRKLSEAVQFTITFFGALGYAFYATWQLSLAVLAASPLLAYSIYTAINLIPTEKSRANALYAKAGAVVTRTVSNIRTILSFNAVQRMVDDYEQATKQAMKGAISNSWLVGLATGAIYATSNIAYIIVTLLGAWLLYSQVEIDGCDPSGTVEGVAACNPQGMDMMGALMGVSFAAGVFPQVSVAIESMSGARAACYPALLAMRRKLAIDKCESCPDKDVESQDEESGGAHAKGEKIGSNELDANKTNLAHGRLPKYVIDSSSEEGIKLTNVKGDIQFRNVTFAFPTRKESTVLSDFNLRAESGMTIAICGQSGCGKSSALSLIERFYDPSNGTMTLDGVDLRQLNVRWLREQIGLVLQEPKLFAKSVKENIAIGCPSATMQEIEEAARMANAYDFIMSFPKGFDTQVGDVGAQLSGGQRHKLAIARVLLKKPKVLLLDEGTSNLDSASEAAVQEALDKVMRLKKVTTFVVAHRLSTIRNAEMIVVMDQGKIIETGTHDSLLANAGTYYNLVQAQKTRQNLESDILAEAVNQASNPPNVSLIDTSTTIDSELGRRVAIRFSDVTFRYPARPEAEVLRNLNLTVYEGETLALVGASGSGKSSIMQLIEGFYRPTAGIVEFYGEDVKNVNMQWLRDEIGFVSQEPALFEGTIADNIKFGFPKATDMEVVEAAKQANCHEFVTEFPHGYETMVRDSGTLSVGQKQRIAIARALIKQPKVLLLDEFTSALDSLSEKVVQAALEKIMARKDQTCIVIAHRLSTVRDADRIGVIDNGTVVEIGTHDELMSKPEGRYRQLQAMQDLTMGTLTPSSNTDNYAKILSPEGAKLLPNVANEKYKLKVETSGTEAAVNGERA
ncbi:hypothetical protein MPSEU_000569400 [Mayamaea pseudoterrestris]|nr:hypothetical protein MPSEU_000569400 [Mayamaea pseudoterrestris]